MLWDKQVLEYLVALRYCTCTVNVRYLQWENSQYLIRDGERRKKLVWRSEALPDGRLPKSLGVTTTLRLETIRFRLFFYLLTIRNSNAKLGRSVSNIRKHNIYVEMAMLIYKFTFNVLMFNRYRYFWSISKENNLSLSFLLSLCILYCYTEYLCV